MAISGRKRQSVGSVVIFLQRKRMNKLKCFREYVKIFEK